MKTNLLTCCAMMLLAGVALAGGPAAIDKPLSGVIGGKKWTGTHAYLWSFQKDPAKYYNIEIVSKAMPDKWDRKEVDKLLVTLPKEAGKYEFDHKFNITFFQPPGKNIVCPKGRLTVTRNGEVYHVELVAEHDKDNSVSGSFTFTPPKGGKGK